MSRISTLFATVTAAISDDSRPVRIVHTHDAGTDLDDEFAALVCAAFHKAGLAEYALTVASYGPKGPRAQLIGGLTARLGLDTVAATGIGAGTAPKVNAYEFALDYLLPAEQVQDGDSLIEAVEQAESDGTRLFVLSTADLTDTRALIERIGDDRAVGVLDRIVWMGGVANFDEETRQWMPELDVQNAKYDTGAATFVFDWAQRQGVPLIVVSRHAATAASVPNDLYGKLPDPVVAATMDVRAAAAVRGLWGKVKLHATDREAALAQYPTFPFERANQPANLAWFIKGFLSGNDPGPDVGVNDDIWPYVCAAGGKFKPYDALAALAMFAPELPEIFSPATRGGSSVLVIGASDKEHNLADPGAAAQVLIDLASYAFEH